MLLLENSPNLKSLNWNCSMSSKLQLREIESEKTWSDFLQGHGYNYFLQTWAWGDFQEQGLGKHVFRLGLYEDETLRGVCLAIEESSRFGKLVYAPRGPVIDWLHDDLRKATLENLTNYFRGKNYLHLRLDPPISLQQTKILTDFQRNGFKPAARSVQVERAWVLDLEGVSEEDLLKNMRKNTRYYIKKGQKAGLTVTFSDNLADVVGFTEMLGKMSNRKGFTAIDPKYLKKQFEFLSAAGIQKLVKVDFEGQTLGMSLMSYYGQEASYLHAATTEDTQKLEPSYYLQWESIRHAKDLGLKRYNFWGVLGEKDYHKGNSRYGYSNFKRGFGGRLEEYMRTQDFVYKPLTYQLFKAQEWYRKKKEGPM